MLHQEITYLKGVGPARAKVLNEELGVHTWRDLLFHYPFRYIDKSQITSVSQIKTEHEPVQLLLECVSWQELGVGRAKRLAARFRDASGDIELVGYGVHGYLSVALCLHDADQILGGYRRFIYLLFVECVGLGPYFFLVVRYYKE